MVIIWLGFFVFCFIMMYVIIFFLVNLFVMEVVIWRNVWCERVVMWLKCVCILLRVLVERFVMCKVVLLLVLVFVDWLSRFFKVMFDVFCLVFFMFCVFVVGKSLLLILVVIVKVGCVFRVLKLRFILFFWMYLFRVLIGFLFIVV